MMTRILATLAAISLTGSAHAQVFQVVDETSFSLTSGDFGAAVEPIGDFNGDGVPDIAVGSPGTNEVFLIFLDAAGQPIGNKRIADDEPDFDLDVNSPATANFGASIAFLGNVDGLGGPEIAVGAPDAEGGDDGVVFVLDLDTNGDVLDWFWVDHGGLSGGGGTRLGEGVAAVEFPGSETRVYFGRPTDGGGSLGWLDFHANGDLDMKEPSAFDDSGLNSSGELGYSLTSLGFLDGGSRPWIAVGAPGDDGGLGRVWIFKLDSAGDADIETRLGDAQGGFGGTLAVGSRFGSSLQTVQDLDGDGVRELLVGAEGHEVGSGNDVGAFWLVYMNDDGTAKHEVLISEGLRGFGADLATGGEFGSAVASLGDLDLDGFPDFAVGARNEDDVHVLFTSQSCFPGQALVIGETKIDDTTTAIFNQLDDFDEFGESAIPIGDFNGDGIPDVAVGSVDDDDGDLDAGAVYFLYLDENGSVDSFDKISETSNNPGGLLDLGVDDEFGFGMVLLDDFDGTGRQVLAVGAHNEGDPVPQGAEEGHGAVYLLDLDSGANITGLSKLTALPDLVSQSQFGTSLDSLGDFDGNGVQDLVVGARGLNGLEGAVYLVLLDASGSMIQNYPIGDGVGGLSATLEPGNWFGHAVATLGDLDGNGVVDIAVGAPQDTVAPLDAPGSVYILFLDSDGTVLAENEIGPGQFAGQTSHSWFGRSLEALGDVDGDGTPDLAVGEPRHDGANATEGAVWILSLNSDGTVKCYERISSTSGGFGGTLGENDRFGSAVASIGDIDGNGSSELWVGARRDDTGGSWSGAGWTLFTRSFQFGFNAVQKISETEGNLGQVLNDGDEYGYAAAGIGDLNGDGIPDMVVSARRDDDFGNAAGAIYVLFLDADGSVTSSTKIRNGIAGFTDPFGGQLFGQSVAWLGNLTDPALPGPVEIAVGKDLPSSGGVWILSLSTSGTVVGSLQLSEEAGTLPFNVGPTDDFGDALAAIGDVDGNGVEDLLVTAQQDNGNGVTRGAAYVLLLNADGTIQGHQKIDDSQGVGPGGSSGLALSNNDEFGWGAAGLGDLDGDGLLEIAVSSVGDDDGEAGNPNYGAIWFLSLDTDGTVAGQTKFSGSSPGFPFVQNKLFGANLGAVGDLNRDGIEDLGACALTGGPNGEGAVAILYMASDRTVQGFDLLDSSNALLASELDAVDWFGRSITKVGDVDCNGSSDLAIGAPRDDDDGDLDAGAVYVLRLNDGSDDPFTIWLGSTGTDWDTDSNWSDGVPNTSIDAVIAPAANQPVVGQPSACGKLVLKEGTTLTLNANLGAHGGATVSGTILGTGDLVFEGDGEVLAPVLAAAIPDVTVNANISLAGSALEFGSLTQVSGTLNVRSGNTTQVTGATSFSGGFLTGSGVLDLDGSTTFSGTSVAVSPDIFQSAALTLDAGFSPVSGCMTLDGPLTVTTSAAVARFHDLVSAPGDGKGDTVFLAEEVDVGGRLEIASGTLDMSGAPPAGDGLILDIDGDWEGDALLNLGSGSLAAGGNVSFGGLLSSGMVVLDSPTNVLVDTGTTLPTVDVESGGTVTISSQGLSIDGDLNITDGDVVVTGMAVDVDGDLNMTMDAGTLTVDTELNINGAAGVGAANLIAGALTTSQPAGTPGVELNVSGDVTFGGTSATTPPKIACAGDWTSDANFAPSLDEVVFDGTTQSISDSLDVLVAFNDLTVQSSNTLTITSDLDVANRLNVEGDLVAEEAATIGGDCDISGTLDAQFGFDCRRDVDISGGELNLGPGNGTIGGSLTGATGSLLGSGMITFDSTLTTPNPIIDTGVDDGMGNTFPMTVDFALEPGGTITVQGSPVVFGTNVALLSGAVVLQTNATVEGDVLVQGGRVDVDGLTDVGGLTGVELQAGEIGGTGQLNINAGALVKTTASLASLVGTGLSIVGDFTLSDGTLAVSGGGTTSIVGNALFSNGEIAGSSVLDVSGNVTFAGAGGTTVPTIRLDGDWTTDGGYSPVGGGEVVFEGNALQNIVLTGPAVSAEFHDLTVGPGATVDSAANRVEVANDLDVSGTLTVPGPLDVGNDLTGDTGGELNLGAPGGSIGHSLTAKGSLTLLASGMITFNAPGGDAIVDTNWDLPTTDVDATGTVTFLGVGLGGIVGNLDHLAGNLVVATTVPISGDALFSGGTLTGSGGGHLVVAGNVDFENTTVVVSPDIDFAGDWDADSGYDPTQGLVSLVGAATQTLTAGGGGLRFFDLDVGGAGGTTTENLTVNGDLTVFSDFGTPPVASIAGDTLVASDGVLNLGVGPHDFGGDLTVDGELNIAGPGPSASPALLGSGNVVHTLGGSTMIGGDFTYPQGSTTFAYVVASGKTANLDTGPGQELPGLILDGEGSFVLSGASVDDATTIAGDIATAPGFAGSLTIAGATNVTGSVTLSSGTWLESVRPVTVEGDVTLDGIQSSQRVQVTCKGDWYSDAAFQPDDGAVLLGDTAAVGTITGEPHFHALKVDEGTYSLEADAVANFGLEVTDQATLIIVNHRLDVAGSPNNGAEPGVLIDGALELGDDAVLGLNEHADVVVNGSLRMVAEWPAEARVEGYLGGDYDFSVFGSLAAKNFSFRDMSGAGIEIDGAAIIASAPEDLRGGTFARAAGSDGPLLDLTANTAHDFRYLKFTNNNANAGSNVTTDDGDPVAVAFSLTNYEGAFAGAANEDDTGDLIEWLPDDRTLVTDFDANPSGGTVALSFTTSVESTDVDVFLLERARNSAGPWLVLAEFTPVGPSTYNHVDPAAPTAQAFFYRVSERLSHGAEIVHDTVVVGSRRLLVERAGNRPTGQPGSGVGQVESYDVGDGGEFATVGELFAAAPWLAKPRVDTALVRLQPGRHEAFTVHGSLGVDLVLIGSEGAEIDVRTDPLAVSDVPEEHFVFLSNLDLVGSTSPAVVVEDCVGAVVFDRLDLSADGLGLPEVRVLETASLVVQASAWPAEITCTDSELTLIDSVVARLEVESSARAAAFGTSIGEAAGFVHQGAGLAAAFDAETREWKLSASPAGSAVRLLAGERPLVATPFDGSTACSAGCVIQVPESRHPLFLQAASSSADTSLSLSRIAIVLPTVKRSSSPVPSSALGRQ